MKLKLVATTIFGLESICAKELRELGFTQMQILDGKVIFSSNLDGIAVANLWLRTAERVYILLGDFSLDQSKTKDGSTEEGKDFDVLYEQMVHIPFENFISVDASFPVRGNAVRSRLTSVPAIQRVCKKAIVDRLRPVYKKEIFSETGSRHSIHVNSIKNHVFVMLDTSGVGLHKRGYREYGNLAPLKETLAAGLIKIAHWSPEYRLIDPFCGSGTILLEAAMMRDHLAPGLHRTFDFEHWKELDINSKQQREAAREEYEETLKKERHRIEGYDIDPASIKQGRINMQKAGVDNVHFQVRDVADFSSSERKGCIISNLPYGERMEDAESAAELYRLLGQVMRKYPEWSKYFLTSHEKFEENYGEKATKNRKLYNAKLKAYYYQYYGKRNHVGRHQ